MKSGTMTGRDAIQDWFSPNPLQRIKAIISGLCLFGSVCVGGLHCIAFFRLRTWVQWSIPENIVATSECDRQKKKQ